VVAALYAALTIALAPISYGPIQFRIPEVMKSLVIWRPHLILAFVVGNFLSNLTSPQVGPWELAFMPFANLAGAALCVALGRRAPLLGAASYATIIAAAVALMLSVLLKASFYVLVPPLLASEIVLIVGGVPIMRRVHVAIDRLRPPSSLSDRGSSMSDDRPRRGSGR
jgi:uncharacterized membrane protein